MDGVEVDIDVGDLSSRFREVFGPTSVTLVTLATRHCSAYVAEVNIRLILVPAGKRVCPLTTQQQSRNQEEPKDSPGELINKNL